MTATRYERGSYSGVVQIICAVLGRLRNDAGSQSASDQFFLNFHCGAEEE
jgi:hypothetical protein